MWQASKGIHIVYESGICSNMIYGTPYRRVQSVLFAVHTLQQPVEAFLSCGEWLHIVAFFFTIATTIVFYCFIFLVITQAMTDIQCCIHGVVSLRPVDFN